MTAYDKEPLVKERVVNKRALKFASAGAIGIALAAVFPAYALAQDALSDTEYIQAVMDNLWVFIAGILVFWMQAGFALLEAGLTRAKNVVNIMAKNLADMFIGVAMFFVVGYGIAYGGGGTSFFGADSFFLSGLGFEIPEGGGLTPATDFFFQVMFAATAVTIASGAMAERTKFPAYLAFSAVMCALIYPVVVRMTWGGGFIAELSVGDAVFSDFAGSGIVHMTGGIAALMGAWMLGPRLGKYGPDGRPRAIPGHFIPMAVLGVFILWMGWFGFNAGSELAADEFVMFVALNTMLAAVGGGIAATATIWLKSGKPDVAMITNGVLAGLVGITAGCGAVNYLGAWIIGLVAGVLVVFSVIFFDKIKIDDPVGAVSVHGVCGVWGVLAIGLFATVDDAFLGREDAGLFYGGGIEQLGMQALLVLIIGIWVAITTGILFFVIKKTIGLRVSEDEERQGLDVLEHGMAGYTEDVVSV
jgi:ammonium transporter, Amt family